MDDISFVMRIICIIDDGNVKLNDSNVNFCCCFETRLHAVCGSNAPFDGIIKSLFVWFVWVEMNAAPCATNTKKKSINTNNESLRAKHISIF